MADAKLNLLRFKAGPTDYVVELRFVKEIIRMVALTKVTELPPFVRGVINLRGEIVPAIDFQMRAGGKPSELGLFTRVIILRLKNIRVGLLVDDVKETLSVESSSVSKNIQNDVLLEVRYILGSLVHNNELLIWADIEKLLTDKEYTAVEKKVKHA